MTTPEIAPTPPPALSESTSSVESDNTLGTEVFDAEVAARAAVMRAELVRTEEAMRTSVKIDLAKVCDLWLSVPLYFSPFFFHLHTVATRNPRDERFVVL